MRKITVLSFITLDGVIQAPGGPEEDKSGGFKYGGWTAPFSNEDSGPVMQKELEPADLLLGRKTFEIFADYWPKHAHFWPGIMEVNKYALSNTIKNTDQITQGWANSEILTSVEEIKTLKESEGRDIKIWGSSELVRLLLKHDLVDEFWLNIHPVVLGKGKRLFDDAAAPASFTLIESFISSTGVIMANYKKAGEVRTGTVGPE